MARTQRFTLLLSIIALCVRATSAQTPPATGTPPFGSYGGGPDVINLANLNSHIVIPVLHKPGRGANFVYDLTYDSSVWYPATSGSTKTWLPVSPTWGWQGLVPAGQAYITYAMTYTSGMCYTGGPAPYAEWSFSNFTYYDTLGTAHPFSYNPVYFQSPGGSNCPPNGAQPSTPQATGASDSSGYTLYATPSSGSASAYIVASNGAIINVPTGSSPPTGTGSSTFTDRNGNQISSSNGVYTDTLGKNVLTVAGSAPSNTTLTYTSPSGGSPQYIVKYTSYTVQTKFACSGIADYPPTSSNLVSEIDLPDGSKYAFDYESTPGDTHSPPYRTGRLKSVTYPTGGTITYSYSGGTNGIECPDGSTPQLTRYTPDGTWLYTRSGTIPATATTVTDPQGNQSVIYFEGIYETQRYVYQGSTSGTLLWVNTTCYNGNGSNCRTTPIALPITEISTNPQFGGTEIQCFHYFFYDSFGNLTRQDDYDYGNYPQIGALLRKTLITYASLGNGITAFPQTTTVQDGAGHTLAQTTNTYDEGALAPSSGTPQHAAVSGSRGNLTTVSQLVQGSTTLTSHVNYWDTGTPNTSTDVNGAVTTYHYADATSTCGNAFPTSISITQPTSMTSSMAWNCTGGVQTSSTDVNSQVTSTTYNDAYFWRPASINYPDGGQTAWKYNSPTSITTTTKMNSSQNIVSTTLLDGLGRTRQTQLGDPQGTDYTDTTYDSLGRLASVSNPYRATTDATYGVTRYQYDAMNRPTLVIPPDGSPTVNRIAATYSTNSTTITTTVTDQAGKKRTSALDSLGRVTQVLEDPAGLNYETDYTFDALGNVLTVNQKGGSTNPANWRTRTYVYDDLSRLTSETNPESGTVTYAYDSDTACPTPNSSSGDLIKRVDARSIRTCYQYDTLHRLTQKNYSDGTTFASHYTYDLSNPWGSPYNGAYKGRLSEEDIFDGSGRYYTSQIYVYDPVGRVQETAQCTPVNCYLAGFHTVYSHDLAGNLTSYETFENNITFSYQYDAASRPTVVTSSLVDAQHPATLATVNAYMPSGSPSFITYGNGIGEIRLLNNTLQFCRMNVNTGGTPLPLTTHCPDNLPYPTLQDFYWTYNEGTSNNGNVAISQGTYGQTFHRSFGYDALNRLSTMSDSITSQACKGLSWGYDAWGNRNQQNVTSGTCNTFNVTADANNRLPGAPYQYDAAGNMIHDASHSYTFDAENRVISVDSGATAKYVYDAEGNRVEKIVGSATTQYVHDPGGRVTLETDGNGNGGPVADYIYLAGKLVAEYKSATTYFLHSDNLGSTRLLTALNKSVFDSMDYLPFGEQVAGGSGTSHKFTEDERDPESNLDHTLFRQYSSSLARWMHPDPAGLAAVDPTNPQSWNRYAYVLDTPVTLFDPFGLCPPGNNTTVYVCADPPPPIPYVPGGCSLSVDGGPATGCGITEVGLALLPASSGWVSWGLFTSIKNSLRTIGNYIPVVCGGGLFNYGPGFRAAAGPVSVSVNPKIRIADSRSGYSEGPFTDLTVGPAAGPQGGVGYATFKGGGSETFLFGGLGFKTGVAQTSVSLFGSHVAGDPLFQNSFGLNGDLGISRTGGGVGAYLNTDSLTSCVDHNFH